VRFFPVPIATQSSILDFFQKSGRENALSSKNFVPLRRDNQSNFSASGPENYIPSLYMTKITKHEVEHIAKLARLELTGEEIEKMQKELSEILDYFNLLKRTKTKGKISEVIKEKKALRKDQIKSQPESVVKKLVEAAPDKKENHIKVKAVF